MPKGKHYHSKLEYASGITSKSGVSFANLQASFGDFSPYYQNQTKYTGSAQSN